MEVHGPNWPSTRALRAALTDIEGPTIYWGRSRQDKLQCLELWRQYGIPCPDFVTSPDIHHEWGRMRRHSQGRDIVMPGHPRWQRSDFWVRVIPSRVEYRVHVWGGVAFRIGVKVPSEPSEMYMMNAPNPIRSSRLGWKLKYTQSILDAHSSSAKRREARALAVRAVAALDLVGGAMDILEGVDGTLYALEVNTAPSLGPLTLERYVERIREWAAGQEESEDATGG